MIIFIIYRKFLVEKKLLNIGRSKIIWYSIFIDSDFRQVIAEIFGVFIYLFEKKNRKLVCCIIREKSKNILRFADNIYRQSVLIVAYEYFYWITLLQFYTNIIVIIITIIIIIIYCYYYYYYHQQIEDGNKWWESWRLLYKCFCCGLFVFFYYIWFYFWWL